MGGLTYRLTMGESGGAESPFPPTLQRHYLAMSSSENISLWQMQPKSAKLRISQFAACVDLTASSLGLQQLRYGGAPVEGHLLGVATGDASSGADPSLSDVFTRGEDLVATIAETNDRPYSLEVYWRATVCKQSKVIDLILSLETPRLESFPNVATHSQLSADEAWFVFENETEATRIMEFNANVLSRDPSCIVIRPEGVDWSYAEMPHPDDQNQEKVFCPTKGQIAIHRHFAATFLEKGVIRRLRLRGAFVPREDDLRLAKKLQSELAAEVPPLTT